MYTTYTTVHKYIACTCHFHCLRCVVTKYSSALRNAKYYGNFSDWRVVLQCLVGPWQAYGNHVSFLESLNRSEEVRWFRRAPSFYRPILYLLQYFLHVPYKYNIGYVRNGTSVEFVEAVVGVKYSAVRSTCLWLPSIYLSLLFKII
jgi:hypothetical protein